MYFLYWPYIICFSIPSIHLGDARRRMTLLLAREHRRDEQLPFLSSFPCSFPSFSVSPALGIGSSAALLPPSPAAPAPHCWIWLLGDRDVQMCPRLARTLSDKSSVNDLMVQGCKPSNFIKFPAASDHSLLHLFYCISAGFRKRRKDCVDIS